MPSREWELARRLSSPEDPGQTEFVHWLERPIPASDHKGVQERRDALRVLVGTMGPPAAHRLHSRLTDARDPLGDFARLELADSHRKDLISLAASRARGFDRGVTTRGVAAPTRPQPPRDKDIIAGRPPRYVPPITKLKEPPPKTPVKPVKPTKLPQGGTPPKLDPKSIYVHIDPNAPNWLASSLSGVAKIAGKGLSMLAAVIPAGVLEEAVEAAWLIFQLERLPAKALVGLAGEMAAEAIAVWVLEDKLGIPASRIMNLNKIRNNFTGLDFLAPELPVSVKTYGVLSTLTGEKLNKSLLSRYKRDAMFLFDTNHTLHVRYQERIGDQLRQNRDGLKANWSASLPANADAKRLAQFVRDKGIMMVPEDHVKMVRDHMARNYFIQYREGQSVGIPKGLLDNDAAGACTDLARRRFISSGLTTSDYRGLADVARRLPEARDAVVKRGKKNWPAEWGDPPTWTGTVARP